MTHSPWSQEAFDEALFFAARAHAAELQTFPGTDLPYLCHVVLVAQEVMAALAVEDHEDGDLALRCALLHDTIEDTAVTHGELAAAFGGAVADGVDALSKREAASEGAEGAERKQRMMADSLRRIGGQPRAVWMVKLADRVSNLRAPPHYWSPDKRARYREEARQILDALGEASPYLAARLEARIASYPG